MAKQITNLPLSAPFGTDIWKKPPSTNIRNAPTIPITTLPLPNFSRARLTFSATYIHQYDQAGLFLRFVPDTPTASTPSWLKAGLEFYDQVPRISFVGCDNYADWSVHDVHGASADGAKKRTVTVELVRQGDENGYALWAYELLLDGEGDVRGRYPLRECTWPLAGEEGKNVEIFAYAARPAKGEKGVDEGPLEVLFERVDVETR